MNKILSLLAILLLPLSLFSMEASEEDFYAALYRPYETTNECYNVGYVKDMVRAHPRLLTKERNGCTPLWVLVGGLNDAKKSNTFYMGHDGYPSSKGDDSPKLKAFKDLFSFFLDEGASIDFNNPPQSMWNEVAREQDEEAYSEPPQIPQEFKQLWQDFTWRRAYNAIIKYDGDTLSECIATCPALLREVNTATQTTLLHEVVQLLNPDNPRMFGIFSLLLSKKVSEVIQTPGGPSIEEWTIDPTVEDGDGNTVEQLMSRGKQEHCGAAMFHQHLTRQGYKDPYFGLSALVPPKKLKGLAEKLYHRAKDNAWYVGAGVALFFVGYLFMGNRSVDPPQFNGQVLG